MDETCRSDPAHCPHGREGSRVGLRYKALVGAGADEGGAREDGDDRVPLPRLELRLLDPDVCASPGEVADLLDDGFVEFGASGGVWDKTQTVAGLAGEKGSGPPAERTVRGLQVRLLAEGVALVTYRAVRRNAGSADELHSLRSSVWTRGGDGRWRMTSTRAPAPSRAGRLEDVPTLQPDAVPTPALASAAALAATGRVPAEVRHFRTGTGHHVYEALFGGPSPAIVVRMGAPGQRAGLAAGVRLDRQLRPLGAPLPEVLAAGLDELVP